MFFLSRVTCKRDVTISHEMIVTSQSKQCNRYHYSKQYSEDMADQKMDSKSQFGNGNGPVFNMEGPTTESQEIQRSDEKRANGIGNGEMQRRIRNIPVLEERRLLALERHIKRKRRRRPYVKKRKSSDITEHQLDKTMAAPNGGKQGDPEAFDFKDERIQVSEREGREVCIQNNIEGTRMAALEKYRYEKQNGLQITNELFENFEVQSKKMEVGEDKQQDVQFDKLVKYLLDGVKSEILEKVKNELKSQSDVKQLKVENQIKMGDVDCMEVKREEEDFTHVTEVNTAPPKDAGIEAKRVNDENLKKEKENFQGEGQTDLEKAKGTENKIDDIRDEKAEQSCNISSTGSKEPTPKGPELEAVKTNQLIKHEVDNGKTGFNTRNKLVLDDYADDGDDEDDDEGFMRRKLFFFSFSQFKKEETCA